MSAKRPTRARLVGLALAAVVFAGCTADRMPATPASSVMGASAQPNSSADDDSGASASLDVAAGSSAPGGTADASSAPMPPQIPGTSCGVASLYFARVASPQRTDSSVAAIARRWSVQATSAGLTSLSVSPRAAMIAVASSRGGDSEVQLWGDDGAKLAELSDGGPIACLAWSPDGVNVAGGSSDGSVRIWDRSGRLVRTLRGSDPIQSLAWSPDGTLLATGAIHFPPPGTKGLQVMPGVVRLWGRDGKPVQTLGTSFTGGKFFNLGWSPDGSLLAGGAVDYHVWRSDGTPVAVPRDGGAPTWAMAWAPDASVLALGDENGQLETVRPSGPSVQNHRFEGDVDSAAYSPDGELLAVGLRDGLSVVQARSLRNVKWSLEASNPQAIWSPDGSSLLVLSGRGLEIYTSRGDPVGVLTGCSGNATGYAWNGATAVAVTDAGRLCSWSVPRAQA
jgi:WD40 repeat protein